MVRRQFMSCAPIIGSFLAICGCTVQSVHSLTEGGNVVREDSLLGDWEQKSSDFADTDARVSITKDEFGRYRLREVTEDDPLVLVGNVVEICDERFLELQEEDAAPQHFGPFSTGIGTHLFARLRIQDGLLTLWWPNDKFFKKAITDGTLSGIVESQFGLLNSRIVLTSPAEQIREIIMSNPQTAFDEPTTYQRIKSLSEK